MPACECWEVEGAGPDVAGLVPDSYHPFKDDGNKVYAWTFNKVTDSHRVTSVQFSFRPRSRDRTQPAAFYTVALFFPHFLLIYASLFMQH